MERRRLKLIFGPAMVKEPVIYQLGKQFEVVTNIRRADVTRDQVYAAANEIRGHPGNEPKKVDHVSVLHRLRADGICSQDGRGDHARAGRRSPRRDRRCERPAAETAIAGALAFGRSRPATRSTKDRGAHPDVVGWRAWSTSA